MQCGEAVVPVLWFVSVESRKVLVNACTFGGGHTNGRSSDGTVRAVRQLQHKGAFTTALDAEVVVSGAREVGRGTAMLSARDVDTERGPTRTDGSTSHADRSISIA